MNKDINLMTKMLDFMDIYNKFKQYSFIMNSNKWIKLGSIVYNNDNANTNLKIELLYWQLINDNYINNLIILNFKPNINNNYNRYGIFNGDCILLQTNYELVLIDIKIIQLNYNIYEFWFHLDNTNNDKCDMFIYGNLNFIYDGNSYDIFTNNYPIYTPKKQLIINKDYIENNFYSKDKIDILLNNINISLLLQSNLEENYVKKSELDNRLLNLVIKSNFMNNQELIALINGNLENNYIKKNIIIEYAKINDIYSKEDINNLLIDVARITDLNKKVDKIDISNIATKEFIDINFVKKNDITNIIIDNSILSEFYNKNTINMLLDNKINNSDTYLKNELDNFIKNKPNIEDIYYKSEIYNKNEINELLNKKVSTYNDTLNDIIINNISFYGNINGLTKNHVGLNNIDNTSDLDKPISLQTLFELNKKANTNDLKTKVDIIDFDKKAPINNPSFTGIVNGITKDMIGLNDVDNTSDINKPLSKIMEISLNNKANVSDLITKAEQYDVNLKAPILNPEFQGVVKGIDKYMVGLGNVNNTSDENKPISKQTRDELETKASKIDLDTKASILNPVFKGIVQGITKDMIGLNYVDNTSDLNKPISIMTQSELNTKAPINNPSFLGTVYGITKNMVGLSNVDNTTDLEKPLSSLMQIELNKKASIYSPTFTGIVSGITKDMIGLNNINNTSDINKPLSTDTINALKTKVDINNPILTGNISCNNLNFIDNLSTSYIKTSNDNLLFGTNNNNNLSIYKTGQLVQSNTIVDNDFCTKLQNISTINGFGLLIDNNNTSYALCIRDKNNNVKCKIGGDGTASFGNNILNIQNDCVGINTNNPQYNLHIEGTAYCTNGIWSPSDERIKTNIIDIDTNVTLDIINKIKVKQFNYIDTINYNNKSEYGVVAQQISNIIPEAINLISKFIPSIMSFSKIYKIEKINKNNNNIFKSLIASIKINIDISITGKIRIYTDNNIFEDVNFIRKDYDNIIVELTKYEFISVNQVLIYGHEIHDFHTVDKLKLLTPLIGAIQELHKKNIILENKLNSIIKKIK